MKNLPHETRNGVLLYILTKIVSAASIYAFRDLVRFASKSQMFFVQNFSLDSMFLAIAAEKALANTDTFRSLRG